MALPAPLWADALEVKLVSITSPIHPADINTLVVETSPGASCTADIHGIRSAGKSGTGEIGHLGARTANNRGLAQWKWRVSGVAGHRTVVVNCSAGDNKGELQVGFDVT
jgi:hypothetical protein